MKSFLLACALTLTPSLGVAQVVTTGPVSMSNSLSWQVKDGVNTAADAQALEARFRANAGSPILVVPNVTCSGATAPFNCQANLTSAIVATLNVTGIYNITLSLYSGAVGLESGQSVPFVLKTPPPVPVSLVIR